MQYIDGPIPGTPVIAGFPAVLHNTHLLAYSSKEIHHSSILDNFLPGLINKLYYLSLCRKFAN